MTLDSTFYEEHGLHFHNQNTQEPQACINLIKEYPSITYLNHESIRVYLRREDGPRTNFKVFGSPYSPASGLWAFGYPPEHASFLWDQIPLDTDFVLTHTPPKYHCDESKDTRASGCKSLRETLWRVRPSLAVCGHVHEARGVERILWDLDCPNVKYKESATGYWRDPSIGNGNRKQCHLDLSAKSLAPLNSIGSWIDASSENNLDGSAEMPSSNRTPNQRSTQSLAWTSTTSKSSTWISRASSKGVPSLALDSPLAQDQDDTPKAGSPMGVTSEYDASVSVVSSVEDRSTDFGENHQIVEDQRQAPASSRENGVHLPSRGQGGSLPSGRCDIEALAGRRGRRETCVINASIMASSWPYKSHDNRKYNKPIIADIDLPVWQNPQ